MLDLGELLLHIGVDDSGVDKSLQGIIAKGTAMGDLMSKAIQKAVGAVVDFGKQALSASMNFDSAMSQVAATMGVTTDEIKDLRDFALEMGSTTKYTATEAAEALNYMALAGYDAETSMKMLPNVLNLAAAGNIDLARASDMVTDAQTALGLSCDETNTLVDQMAKVSSTTNTSVEQLGEGILKIGATARTVKGGTSELTQVLGLLADNGIKSAEGGTHLRNVILSLQNPTDKAAGVLKKLGVTAYDNEGNFRSLQDIFMDLQGSLDGLTEQQRQEALATIFNKTDLASVNALLGTDVERWNEVAGAIDNATGAAEKMANTQLDNLEGDVTLFKSALEGLQIQIMEGVTPALRDFTQFGTEAMGRLGQAFKEGGFSGFAEQLGKELANAIKKIAEYIPEIIKGAAAFIGGFIKGLMDSAPDILDSIQGLLDDLLKTIQENGPEMVKKGAETLTKFLKGIAERLPDLIKTGFQIISELVNSLAQPECITEIINAAIDVLTNLITGILENLPMLIEAGINLILALVEGLINAIPKLIEALPQIIEALVSGIIQAAPKLLAAGVELIWALIKGIISLVPQIPKLLWDVVKAIFNGIVDGIKGLFGIHSPSTVMADLGMNMITGLINGIGGLVGKLIEGVANFCGKIKDTISNAWNSIKEKTSEIWGNIKNKVSETWNNIKEKASETWNNMKEKASETWSNMKSKVTEIATGLKDKLSDTWNNVKDKASTVWNNIKDKVSDTASNLKDKVTNTFTNLKDKASDIWNNAKDKIVNTVSNLKDKAVDHFNNMKDKISTATSNVKDKVTSLWNSAKDNVSNTVNNLKDKVSNVFTNIKDKISNTMTTVKDNMKSKWETAVNTIKNTNLSQIGSNLINGFKNSLSNAWSSVTSWASNAVNNLKNSISNAVSWVKNKVSGSHRTGLSEVPYDGYIAELHKGEQVLTAAQANQYQKWQKYGQQNQGNTTINFNGSYQFANQNDIDYFMSEAGRLIKRKVG